jgi:hypothetical protein
MRASVDRSLDGATEGDVVRRVDGEAHIRERVLDLLALVEAHAPDDAVRHARAPQRVLEHARLRIGPVEDGDALPRHAVAPEAQDRLGDEVRLLVLVPGPVELGPVALGVLGPEGLFLAPLVVIDHGRGERQDAPGRAIVLLELHDAGAGIVPLEIENVPDVGAPPLVDRVVNDQSSRDVVAQVLDG